MLKIALFLMFALGGMNAIGQSTLQAFADKWAEDPVLRHAGISLYVYDLNKNLALVDINSDLSLVPASTMKLVTTASAFEILGGGYRFRTRIAYTGNIDSAGTLYGNIYIIGGADPSLGSGYYKNFNSDFLTQWVEAVKGAGIRHIMGRVIADAGVLDDNSIPVNWSWGDIGNYYGAPACGLTIYDNKTTLTFKSGALAGDSTWITGMDPFVPEMTVYNKVKAANSNADNAYIYGGLYDPNRLAEGSIPKGRNDFEVKISLHDPAYLAAYELEKALNISGVSTASACTTVRRLNYAREIADTLERHIIHTLDGATVGNLCYFTNMQSVNLFAEHLFSGIGLRYYGDGSTYSSSKAINTYWQKKGVDMMGLEMTDGSGLSRGNAISAKHLATILRHMNASKNAESFKETLSVAGKSGTLRTIGQGTRAAGNLIGKSGSMDRVRSYAGYVTSASGSSLVFAVIVNNYTCTGYQMKERLENLMVNLANYTGN